MRTPPLRWRTELWETLQGCRWAEPGCFFRNNARGWLVRDGDYWALDWDPPGGPPPPNAFRITSDDWNLIRGGRLAEDGTAVVKEKSTFVAVPMERPARCVRVHRL